VYCRRGLSEGLRLVKTVPLDEKSSPGCARSFALDIKPFSLRVWNKLPVYPQSLFFDLEIMINKPLRNLLSPLPGNLFFFFSLFREPPFMLPLAIVILT